MLGTKISRVRKERHMTQEQMASKIGISPSYLSRIEGDGREISVALLVKIAEVAQVPVSYFLDSHVAFDLTGMHKTVTLPIVSEAALRNLGQGSPLDREGELMALPELWIEHPDDTFIYRVKGGAMTSAHIPDGSQVVVDTKARVYSGDTVCVQYGDAVVVRGYVRHKGRVEFTASDASSLEADEGSEHYKILGKVVRVISTPPPMI